MNNELKAISSEKITIQKRDEYFDAKYLVKTVIPHTKEPVMNTYIFSQGDLDSFLGGYGEFAEFIISIEKISEH